MPPKGRGRKGSTSDAGTTEEVVVGTFETLRDEGEHFVHVQQFEKAIESFTKVIIYCDNILVNTCLRYHAEI